MSGLEIIAGIAGLAGTALQAAGTIKAGNEAEDRFEYEAKVKQQRADEARAAGQRAAMARQREGELVMSRQRAYAAAQGGGADASVIDIMADTASEVDLGVKTEMFKGEQQGRGYDDAAKISLTNARNAASSSKWAAAGTLFGGVTSMYSRFARDKRRSTSLSTISLPYG